MVRLLLIRMENQISLGLGLGEIIGLATEKVNLGRQLMSNLKNLLEIEGVRRIKEQISREVNNLLIVSIVCVDSTFHSRPCNTLGPHSRRLTRAQYR